MLRPMLHKKREMRVRPGLDDKILADWNGLMIAALVNAGIILDRLGWLTMAERAFDFVAQQMVQNQRLGHSWRAGKLLFPGLASDFAAMIRAALALYEATAERTYLERALTWQRAFDAHYADPDTGGYYLSADDAADLLLRPHSTMDDATPNPNAVAAQNLVRLAVLAGDDAWRAQADRLIEGILSAAERNLFRGAAQCARLASARRRDRADGQGRRPLCASGAEIAVPRPYRAARACCLRPAGCAPSAGKNKSRVRKRRLRLCRRAVFVAGDGHWENCRSGCGDAGILIRHPEVRANGSARIAAR